MPIELYKLLCRPRVLAPRALSPGLASHRIPYKLSKKQWFELCGAHVDRLYIVKLCELCD